MSRKPVEFPRFSRTLRLNTALEPKRIVKNGQQHDPIYLRLQRSSNKGNATWKELKVFLKNSKNGRNVIKSLNELWSMTRDLIGLEEKSDIVDDAALFLLNIFFDVKIPLMSHLVEMKKIFEPVTTQSASKMCFVVGKISPLISSEYKEFLQQQSNETDEEHKTSDYWGSHVTCELPSYATSVGVAILQEVLWQPRTLKVINDFSMQFNEIREPDKRKLVQLNRSWLLKHVNPDLIDALIDTLKSSKSNEELQNEVFEIVGFDKFEIIQKIFDNRNKILKKIEIDEKRNQLKLRASTHNSTQINLQRSIITPQVIVLSIQEKQSQKQVRKDEKKLRNFVNSMSSQDTVEQSKECLLTKLRVAHQNSLLQQVKKDKARAEHNRI